MRTVLAALGVLCFMGSCSSGMTSSKGIVCDATMNTVAIVTDKNDTLSFSTMNANKEEVDGLLLNDTLEVFYTGKYTPGMQASKLVQYGVKCSKTASGCLKKVSGRRLLMEALLLLLLCSVPIPHVWNFSSLMNNRMRFWKDVAYLREVMHGTWRMMIRKMYGL